MRDVVGVPPLGEHRHRDDAPDAGAELIFLADCVHDLAEQVLIGDAFGGARITRPLDDFSTETFDFVCRHRTELVVQRFTRFELLGIDQQRVWARERIAGHLVEVAKQRKLSVLDLRSAVLFFAFEARNIVVYQLRHCRVLADDDEARRHGDAALPPQIKRLRVMSVQRFERRPQPGG